MEKEKRRTEMKTWFKCLYVSQGKRWERKNKIFSRRLILFNRTLERSNFYCNTSNELNAWEIEVWLVLFAHIIKNIIDLFFRIHMIGFAQLKSSLTKQLLSINSNKKKEKIRQRYQDTCKIKDLFKLFQENEIYLN